MPKISELPADTNIIGNERLPAVDSNNTNVSITPQALSNFIVNNVQNNIHLTTDALARAKTYPAVGDIKKGQGVIVFQDPANNNTPSVKAQQGDAVTIGANTASNFATNLDGFSFGGNPLTTSITQPVKYASAVNDAFRTPSNVNSTYGVRVPLVAQANGSYEWNPSNNIGLRFSGRNVISMSAGSQNMNIHRVFVSSSGGLTIWYSGTFYVWYENMYRQTGSTSYTRQLADGTDWSYSSSNQFSRYEGSIGSINSTYPSILLYYSLSDSSSISNTSNYRISSYPFTGYWNYISANEDTNKRLEFTLVQDGGNPSLFTATFNPARRYKSIASGVLNSITGLSLNGLTLTVTGTFGTSTMDLYIGDTLIASDDSGATSRVFNINATQKTAFTNNSNKLSLLMYESTANEGEDIAKIRQIAISATKSNISEFTDSNFSLSRFGSSYIIRDTDDTFVMYGFCRNLTALPKFAGTGNSRSLGAYTNTLIEDIAVSRNFLAFFRRESGTWNMKSIAGLSAFYLNKTNGNYDIGPVGGKVYKTRDTSTEMVFGFINSLGSGVRIDDDQLWTNNGQILTDASAVNTNNSTYNFSSFFKVNKTSGAIAPVLNESGNDIRSYFTQTSPSSASPASAVLIEVGTESAGTLKLVYACGGFHRLLSATKGTLGTYEKWTMSQVVNYNNSALISQQIIYDPIVRYDAEHRCVYYSYLTSTYGSIYRFCLNASLTDFARSYNSSTRAFDASSVELSSVFITANFPQTSYTYPRYLNDPITAIQQTGNAFQSAYIIPRNYGSTITGTLWKMRKSSSGLSRYQAGATDATFRTGLTGSVNAYNTSSTIHYSQPFNMLRYSATSGNQTTYTYRKITGLVDGSEVIVTGGLSSIIGLASDNYSDGDNAIIQLLTGSNILTFSGLNLITGADYFINTSTFELNHIGGIRVGLAISPTQILRN